MLYKMKASSCRFSYMELQYNKPVLKSQISAVTSGPCPTFCWNEIKMLTTLFHLKGA